MLELIKTLFNIDTRPQWVKDKDAKLIAAIKRSGDNIYVTPGGSVHRNPNSNTPEIDNERLMRENEVLRSALENVRGFLINKGYSPHDPLVLGLIEDALNYKTGGDGENHSV